MSEASVIRVPDELKDRIEQAARERELNPSSLLASALDLFIEAEAVQGEVARRRLALRKGKTIPNDRVNAWLATWGLDKESPPPRCE